MNHIFFSLIFPSWEREGAAVKMIVKIKQSNFLLAFTLKFSLYKL